MAKMMKRLTAMLLVLCTLASFVVPATFADAGEGTINFDFQLRTNSVLSGTVNADGFKYSKAQSAVEAAYKAGTHNWMLEAVETGVSTANNIKFFSVSDEGMRLLTIGNKWLAFRLNVPQAGTYDVSMTASVFLADHNYNATAWIFAAPSSTMAEADVAAKMVNGNKVGTASFVLDNATDSFGTYTFEKGEYILVLRGDNSTRMSIADINLIPAEGGSTQETTVPGADLEAEPVKYDFELYKDSRYASVITGSGNKYWRDVETTIKNAYAANEIDWKVEAWHADLAAANVVFTSSNNEGLRMTSAAGKWVAFRLRVEQTGEFALSITSNHAADTYNYKANTWLIPASASAMAVADLEAAMVDANKLGTAAVTVGNPGTLGVYTFTAGEYILIVSVDNNTRASIANINLTPKTEGDEPSATTEATTAAPSESTAAPETTLPQTTAGNDAIYTDNIFDFKLYNYSYFSQTINGLNNKLSKTAVKTILENAYPSVNNWKVEVWSADTDVANMQFNTKEGFSMRIGAGKWVAFRLNVTKAGRYEVIYNLVNKAQAYRVVSFVVPAPAQTMTAEEAESYMNWDYLLGNVDIADQDFATIGEYDFSVGEYILILGCGSERMHFGSVELVEPGSKETQPTEPEETTVPTPVIPTQPNVPNGPVFESNTFDFELYNNSAFSNVIYGDEGIKYRKVKSSVKDAYPSVNNWVIEGYEIIIDGAVATSVQAEDKLLFVKKDPAFRLNIGIGNWVAIRLNVPKAGQYDVVFNSTKEYSAEAWMIPASAETMSTDTLKAAMTDAYKLGDVRLSKDVTSFNAATRNFEAGEYILILKANTERINLQNIQLTAVGEVEKPQEDTRPEYEMKPGFFDMRLFNYKGFDILDAGYVKYSKAASMMDSKYPEGVNWILEGHSAKINTTSSIQFIKTNGEGLRASAPEGATGEWIALRLNNTKAGNYDLIVNSDMGIYSGKVYLFPATAETMTTQQISAAMTEKNLMGNVNFTSDTDSVNLGEYNFAAGAYIIVLQADDDRVTVDSIEIIDHYVELPKEPVDKIYYDFDLVKLDPQFNDKGFTNWYSKTEDDKGILRVYQKLAEMYKDGIINWKYETMSDTASRFNCRVNHTQVKAATNFMEVENAWNALRIAAPGAGTYDVRIYCDTASSVVADVYLIPAKTGIAMTNEEIEGAMTEKNLLVAGALINGDGTFYLGEYTFGAEYEYVLVMKFTRGKRLYFNNIQMTKDGLVADTEVKKLPTYNGVVYDFDLGDEFTGLLQPFGKYRYDASAAPEDDGKKYEVVYKQVEAAWKSGKINWNWVAASDDLVNYDGNAVASPNEYIRFYQDVGMHIYSKPDSWVALKIKSPGSGDFTLTMNHAVSASDGTVAVYIIPGNTPLEEIYNTTDPSNRVGKVLLTKPDGSSGKEDGFESFVGYWNFEAGKEYILVLEAYAASQFSATLSNMNISNIVMQQGIHKYETDDAKTVKPVTVKERVLATSDLGNGNVAIFEMDGMDYYLTQLEGGTMLLYNLTTGELEKENYLSTSRPRHMAVAPDGKIWFTGSGKFLACYDPKENTIEKTKTWMPSEYKHNGFSYMTITPEGIIYADLNQQGNIIEYNPKTKQFRDLGYFTGEEDYTNGIIYDDGYLYYNANSTEHNWIIKYNIATGEAEAIVDVEDSTTENITALSFLGEDILVCGAKTRDNDHTVAFNKHTMERVDLGLPGSVSKLVSSEINGKQYMVLASYGLYEYDVETKEITKTPGFTEMTGTGFRGGDQHSFGKSWAMINGDLCLISNDSQVTSCPRVVNLTKKEYYRWTDLTREANGGGSRIISFTETEPGAGELVMGHWNAEFISTYNIYTGEITKMDSAGQTDSIGYYKGILYGGCYSATVLVELHRETEEIIQRFKLDHDITEQKRLLSMETGGDHVFVGSIPDSFHNGGALTVYNTITGQWYMERNLVQDQSIIDEAYWNEMVFVSSSRQGGDNSEYAGDSALIVAYDYLNRKKLAELDLRDYIPGLPSPILYVYGLTADPNAEENGRIWAMVSDVLVCFTFDKETCEFDVQVVKDLGHTKYNISSGVARTQAKIDFVEEKNQLYVMFKDAGMQLITLEDWEAPIGKVKISSMEKIMGHKPEDYIIAEDGNMYFGEDADLMMLPLNVTDEDWAIAGEVDAMFQKIHDGEITLATESEIRSARSAYENLSWRYKALIQKLELLQEAESDILECKVEAALLVAGEIDADDYPAMLELNEEYKGLTKRQQRYVKNYDALEEAYETSSDLNDQRCAAAMQEKVNALQELFPIESLEKQPQVDAVRAEFEAMPGRQRILVDLTVLEEAEAQIAVLRAALVKEVEALIQAIPDEITLAAEPAITAAREGVDKLTALERKQVSYSKLEASEAKLRNLKNAVTKAAEVDAMIKAIGIVTLGDKARIAQARQAYNALNETARAFVTKYGKLKRAEFILSGLQTWMIPAFVVVGAGAAFCVVWFVPSLHSKVFKTKKKETEEIEQ